MLTKQGGITETEAKTVDFAKIGWELLNSGKGKWTEKGLLFFNEDVPQEKMYNGETFPEYDYNGECLFGVKISFLNAREYVYLPCEELAIKKALARLGVEGTEHCELWVDFDRIEDEKLATLVFNSVKGEDIYDINAFADEMNNLTETEKFFAVVEYGEAEGVKELTAIAKNLDEFEYAEGVDSDYSLGEYLVDNDADYECSDYLRDYINYEELGGDVRRNGNGIFITNGCVYISSGKNYEEVLDKDMGSVNAKNGNYYVYKSEENPEKQVAYFTQARLDEVVKKYAEKTIQHWYYWQKEPESCLDGDLNAYPNEKKIVATEVELREGLIYALDGEPYAELTITEPGSHTLLIEDGYGNSVEYEIYILNSAPTMEYALGENSPSKAEFDRTYYFKDCVTVSIPFEGDEFAMFEVVNADTGESLGYFDIANACYIEESGSYTAVAYNHYGESKTFSFVVSMNAPTITMKENAENKTLDITVGESTDKVSHITFLEISKSDDGGETWIALTEDDYGKEITIETLEYHFRTSGLYKVTVMDEFRTGIDSITQTIEYKQPIPVGVLAGVEDKGYTNKAVTFTWTDDALVSLMKDGVAVEYKSGQKLTADGAYVLTFSNYDGYSKTYSFVIDTVAPVVTLEGAKVGEFVNAGVKAHFANDETAEIFKNGSSLGAYLVGSNVEEDGEYRIVVKDKALNETTVTFTVDTTVEWSININEKGLSNSVVITAGEEVGILLMKDGVVVDYTLGEAITEIGEYSLEITDSLGNTAIRNFTIVDPIVREFTHNFDNVPGFEKVLVNGEDKRLNYGTLELFADGVYEVGVVVDGETYTFTVTVDSTLPTITLNGVENGGATNGNVTIATTEETAKLTVYFKGEEIAYTASDELTAEGDYRAVATDLAGNSVEAMFSIDKTAPVLTLVGVENGGATNGSVSVQVNDGDLIVYLNDTELEYVPGEELTAEGSYFVQACDSVGNVSEVMFTIDKTGPVLTLNGVEKDGTTNRNVVVDATDDTSTLKVYLNGEEINYEEGNELKAEGVYLVTAIDALGNITEISFNIDKTAPTIILNGVENKGSTRKAVSLGETSEEATVTVYFNDEEITYKQGDSLTKVGKYRVVVTDSSNNASEYTFTIEKKVSNGEIALIVIGGLGIVGGIVFFILKKRKII